MILSELSFAANCQQLSEEIQSAATVVPQAIMWTISLNGLLAWTMTIAMLFCVGDLEAALESQSTLFYPIIAIFKQAVKSMAGAQLLVTILVIMSVASAVSIYASASRLVWAFSRDQGLPFSNHLMKVSILLVPYLSALQTNSRSCRKTIFQYSRFWQLSLSPRFSPLLCWVRPWPSVLFYLLVWLVFTFHTSSSARCFCGVALLER